MLAVALLTLLVIVVVKVIRDCWMPEVVELFFRYFFITDMSMSSTVLFPRSATRFLTLAPSELRTILTIL